MEGFKAVNIGEIWICELPHGRGSIQNGSRPVFVLSNNKNNAYSPTVNVIPLTTKMNKRDLPVHVELWDCQRYGLVAPSTMLIEQITTVPMTSLVKRLGSIEDNRILKAIWEAICIQFPVMEMVK